MNACEGDSRITASDEHPHHSYVDDQAEKPAIVKEGSASGSGDSTVTSSRLSTSASTQSLSDQYGAGGEEDEERLVSEVTVVGRPVARQKGTSWYGSVFLVVNAALGAGLLNFPAAYDQSGGLAVALSVQAVLMVFVVASLLILTYCSDLNHSASYQDVVFSLCGKAVQVACAVCMALYCFGTCITFFIIIADQWEKFFSKLYPGEDLSEHWYTSRTFTLVTSTVIIVLPMCFSKRIDFLKYASAFGVIAVIYCAILVIVKYFINSETDRGPMKHRDSRDNWMLDLYFSPTHWVDVFIVVPVICFGYQCHLSVIPIYSCLEKRTVGEFSKTLAVAMAVCVFTYSVVASFGYMTFGSKVNPDILLSYKPTADVLVAVVMIGAKMYVTYPILLFVGRSAFDSVWVYLRKLPPQEVASGERRRRYITTVIWFVTSLFLAVVVPNISDVISLLGGLAAVFVFTFPGLCLLQVVLRGYVHPIQRKHFYRLCYFLAVFSLIFGAFLFGEITAQSIYKDLGYGS